MPPRGVRWIHAIIRSYLQNQRFDYAATLCLFANQILEELEGVDVSVSLFDDKEEEVVNMSIDLGMKKEVEMLNCRIKAEAVLASASQKEGEAVKGSLNEHLNENVVPNAKGQYDIIRIPVPMHSSTCKPLFFDLFADYVNYPKMDSRVKVEEKKGWFSGWWYLCFATNTRSLLQRQHRLIIILPSNPHPTDEGLSEAQSLLDEQIAHSSRRQRQQCPERTRCIIYPSVKPLLSNPSVHSKRVHSTQQTAAASPRTKMNPISHTQNSCAPKCISFPLRHDGLQPHPSQRERTPG